MRVHQSIFVRILLPFCAGIAVSKYAPFAKLNLFTTFILLLILFLSFIFNYLYISSKVYHHKIKLALLLYLSFFFLGAFCVFNGPDYPDSDHFSAQKANYLKIYIADEPHESAGLIRFRAKITAIGNVGKLIRSAGLLMVTVDSKSSPLCRLDYGQGYLIPARYIPIPSPLNPGEFDSQSWLANQQIYHQIFLSTEELIPLREKRGSAILSFALKLRKAQVQRYRKLIRNDQAFAVAATLVLGYRADLDAETLAAYAQTGTIHALSVSGMHVSLVYVVLELALQWMNRKQVLKWMKIILIITLIWSYTVISGCSASVLRSAIMLSLLILSKAFHKNNGGFHLLALSAFVLLFTDPLLLWDVGFQLSYLAVMGLIYLHPKIHALCSFKWWFMRQAWSITSVSLSAQLFTWPLSIYYFHQFPLYFVLSNLFIALPVTLLMYAGLAIVLLPIDCIASPFEWLLNFMNHGLERIAGLPYSTLHPIWITTSELCLLCPGIFFVMTGICNKKKQHLFCGLFLFIFLQGMLLGDKLEARQQNLIILYSLNRHYAVAFIQSDKAILLTDLVPRDKAFRFHIQPSLGQRRISQIVCIRWESIQQHGEMDFKGDAKGFLLKDHQIYFHQFKILLVDSFFNRRKIIGNPRFDAVWIHGSPSVKRAELRKTIRFQKIWLDVTNKNGLIHEIETDTIIFKNSVEVFKKIKASLINLK